MVVTGIGIVSPLGIGREATWSKVVAGEPAAGPISAFDATGWRTNFACEVKGFSLSPDAVPKGREAWLNRASSFGLAAALEAMEDAGLAATRDASPERFGVSVGVGIGSVDPSELTRMMRGIDVPNAVRDLARQLEAAKEALRKYLACPIRNADPQRDLPSSVALRGPSQH